MHDAAIALQDLELLPASVTGQVVASLCWAAVVALSWVAWRRRRGRDAADLLVAAGLWLAVRVGLLLVVLPTLAQAGSDWLTGAVDLAGLSLLAWPFLAPPLPTRWADRLVGAALATVALACGVAVWQWVRGALGLSLAHPPAVTWAHSAFALAGLAALNLLARPARRLGWMLTVIGALLVGAVCMLTILPASSPVLTAGTAALAAALLNWLDRSPRRGVPAALEGRAEPAPGPWRPSRWLEASTALFAAPDLAHLLKAATAALAHVVTVRVAGLFLAEEEEPLRLRLAARQPPLDEPATPSSFSPGLVPVLADALARRQIVGMARESHELLIEPLDRILGAELKAVLILPLAEAQQVRGALALESDEAGLNEDQRQLCSRLADQVAIAIGHLQLRFKIVEQARSLAHLVRRHRQETDRLTAILESIADGVVVSDGDDVVVMANGAALALLGMEMDDVLGQPFRRVVGRAVKVGDLGVLGMATGSSPYSMELLYEIAGRSVQTSLAPIEGADGVQMGVVALMRDVTPQVRAEAEREHQLADLQEQNRQLAEAAEHLQELAWAGTMELDFGDTDLRGLIEDVVRTVTPLIGDKPVTVVRALEFGLPVIRADETRLRQVLLNLLTSAVEHTKEGQIAVSASHGEGYVIVGVAHMGADVSRRYLEAVSEGLGRAEAPTSRKTDGLRLSLATSRRLIELHGGRMWARKGRVLFIYVGLPVAGPGALAAIGRLADGGPPAGLRPGPAFTNIEWPESAVYPSPDPPSH